MLLLVASIPVAMLIFIVGKAYFDIPRQIEAAKSEADNSARAAMSEINASKGSALEQIASIQRDLTPLQEQVLNIKKDVYKYQQVNDDIKKLQLGLQQVKGDVVDIGNRKLKTGPIEATGAISSTVTTPGTAYLGFSPVGIGCAEKNFSNVAVAYCSTGHPLELNQVIPGSSIRPVASYSEIGFQDMSTLPKKECTQDMRGTIYVEKGEGHRPDKGFICVRVDTNSFRWEQITTAN